MNEPKWTPGPWKVQRSRNQQNWEIRGPEDCIEATIYISSIASEEDLCITEANARLVAAAPTLFAACKWALDILTEDCADEQCWTEAPYHRIWAALNKALGEPETPKS
jgi:hypothetical protein